MTQDFRHQLWLIYSQLKDAENDPDKRLGLLSQSREELGQLIDQMNQQAEPGLYAMLASNGAKGGAAKTEAKAAAARSNGAKGGRPAKPNLFIRFAKSVWQEPDPKLLNELYKLVGNNTWLPDERGDEKEGPYVRVHVPEINTRLEKLLSNSMNVFEWDEKGLYRFCPEHVNNAAAQMRTVDSVDAKCITCGKQAHFIF